MAAGNPAFGIDRVVTAVIDYGTAFVQNDSSKAGMTIFWLIFAFHIVEGAAELVGDPRSCRLFKSKFWLRICLVTALLAGYQAVVVGTVATLQPRFMTQFADKWSEVWGSEWAAMDTIKNDEADNQDLKHTEVNATKTGQGDDSWSGKMARFVADAVVTGFGFVIASITACLITVFMLMEGFYGLGMNMVLIAVGPICIAFAAHEKTEAIFWSFVKAFLVLGLLYMPLLGVACAFAGIIMAHMTEMTQSLHGVYGDGSDIAFHVIMVIVGPICSFAVIRAVPATLAQLLQSMSGGGGSSFAAGAALAMVAARGAGGAGKGGGNAGGGGGAEGGGKGGGLDAAGERGRAQAAIAALSRAGGQPSSGPPPIQGAADGAAADQLRGEK